MHVVNRNINVLSLPAWHSNSWLQGFVCDIAVTYAIFTGLLALWQDYSLPHSEEQNSCRSDLPECAPTATQSTTPTNHRIAGIMNIVFNFLLSTGNTMYWVSMCKIGKIINRFCHHSSPIVLRDTATISSYKHE